MKKEFTTAAIITATLLTGCATAPVSTQVATPVPQERILDASFLQEKQDTVLVVVKRDGGFLGSACSSRVFIDSKPVADLKPSEKVSTFLTKEVHIIGAESKGICGGGLSEVESNLSNGKPASFRIRYGSNGDYSINRTAL